MSTNWYVMSNEKQASNGPNLDRQEDRLAKLWPSLSDMTPDELREHIRYIRGDRRRKKEVTKTKKAATRKTDATLTKAKKLLNADPELLAKILREMGDTDGNGS